MASFDHVIIGSGINSLVCAALLAKAGRRICVLERNAVLGGAIRTEEATLPGFHHDLMSCWHPLFVASPAFSELKSDLEAHGLQYLFTPKPSGVVLNDGRHFILTNDAAENACRLNELAPGDGDRFAADMHALGGDLDLVFSLLGGELWSRQPIMRLVREAWRRGATGFAKLSGGSVTTCKDWTDTTFRSGVAKAMFAPWVLHTGLAPNAPMSQLMARVIAFTLQNVGVPVPRGGGVSLVSAFTGLLTHYGAELKTSTTAKRIEIERGRAVGLRTSAGEFIAAKSVVANVTPNQLYGELIESGIVASDKFEAAKAYRFGRAGMQIHLALSKPAEWAERALNDVGLIHLTGGTGTILRSVLEADEGLLPVNPTVVVGQPSVIDPSRVPPKRGMMWIQLLELPRNVVGDAAGTLACEHGWTNQLAESFADRIVQRIERHVPGLSGSILGRHVISPTGLEALNCNLVGGDPYSGDCALDQFGVWRPFPGSQGHKTGIRGLWHIGASTHPGPGLGGGSGYLVAKALL